MKFFLLDDMFQSTICVGGFPLAKLPFGEKKTLVQRHVIIPNDAGVSR